MKKNRVMATVAVATALVGAICFLPLPFHVDCAMEIQPQNASHVFAMVPGRLVRWHKHPGDQVQAGDVIAELESTDVRLQQVKSQGELMQAEERLEALKGSQFGDPQALALIQVNHEVVQSRRALLEKANQRAQMLVVHSPVSGSIIQPPSKPEQKGANEEEQLPTWSGNPFAPKHAEAYFAQSDLLCLVGDPRKMEAVLVVDQADIDLVRPDKEDGMKFDSGRLNRLTGKIGQISQMDMKVTPENLATQAGGSLDTEMDASGHMRPLSTSYQARVPLDNVDVPLRAGYRGQAKVYVGWKSIGWRFYRFLARTFRFEM
jgi:putative peptide zinc metalloprotease protein